MSTPKTMLRELHWEVLDDWVESGHTGFLKYRKWLALGFSLSLATVIGGLLLLAGLKYVAKVQRNAAYYSVLRSYQKDLKPGVGRNDVESYLRERHSAFDQFEEFDQVMIGKEHPITLFCGPEDIFVEFRFTTNSVHVNQANEGDTLKAVSLAEKSEGCL